MVRTWATAGREKLYMVETNCSNNLGNCNKRKVVEVNCGKNMGNCRKRKVVHGGDQLQQ